MLKNRYLKYNPRITIEILEDVVEALLVHGWKMNSFLYKDVKGLYRDFVASGYLIYSSSKYGVYACHSSGCINDSIDTEISVEEILGYNPFEKEDFVLPEKWCVKASNKEEDDILIKWRDGGHCDEIGNSYMLYRKFWTPNKEGCTEIFFEQFKKHVLKEPEESPKIVKKDWSKVSKEELLEEAKRRYPIGCVYKSTESPSTYELKSELEVDADGYVRDVNRTCHVYYRNKWAEIISLPKSKVEAEVEFDDKNWQIKTTPEVITELKKYDILFGLGYDYTKNVYYGICDDKIYNNGKFGQLNPRSGIDIISLEQLKEYVLSKLSKIEDDKQAKPAEMSEEELLAEAKRRYPLFCTYKAITSENEYVRTEQLVLRKDGSVVEGVVCHLYERGKWAEVIALPEYVECIESDTGITVGNVYKIDHSKGYSFCGLDKEVFYLEGGKSAYFQSYFKLSNKEQYDLYIASEAVAKSAIPEKIEYVECIKGCGSDFFNIVGKIYQVKEYNSILGELTLSNGKMIHSIFFGEKSKFKSNSTDYEPSTKEAFDLQESSGKNGMFLKDEYIVFTESSESNQGSFPLNYVYKQRENKTYLCPYLDFCGSRSNGWEWHRNFNKNYKSNKSDWRYATQQEIDKYEELGRPFDISILKPIEQKSINKWDVGTYIVIVKHESGVLLNVGDIRKIIGVSNNVINVDGDSLHIDREELGQIKWFATKSEAEEFAKTLVSKDMVVHCKTQEEWDFVLSKLPESCRLSKENDKFEEYIGDYIDEGGIAVHVKDCTYCGIGWFKENGYVISSFQEWCKSNEYKYESHTDMEKTENKLKLEIGKWYKNPKWGNPEKDFCKCSSENITSTSGIECSEKIYNGVFSKSRDSWRNPEECILASYEEYGQYLPEGHPDKIISKQESIMSTDNFYVKCESDEERESLDALYHSLGYKCEFTYIFVANVWCYFCVNPKKKSYEANKSVKITYSGNYSEKKYSDIISGVTSVPKNVVDELDVEVKSIDTKPSILSEDDNVLVGGIEYSVDGCDSGWYLRCIDYNNDKVFNKYSIHKERLFKKTFGDTRDCSGVFPYCKTLAELTIFVEAIRAEIKAKESGQKPAKKDCHFEVGDWVHHKNNHITYRITEISDDGLRFKAEFGLHCDTFRLSLSCCIPATEAQIKTAILDNRRDGVKADCPWALSDEFKPKSIASEADELFSLLKIPKI